MNKKAPSFWPFLFLFLCILNVSGQDHSLLTIDRLYPNVEFKPDSTGTLRWLDDGTGYSTLLKSKSVIGGKDIARIASRSGNTSILVPAERLIPAGETIPLKIDDYTWSENKQKLLIFTNAIRVWRRKTRGDYWVLDLTNWHLQKLGGEVKPSTLMFAKFSPDARKVAYVREKDIYVEQLANRAINCLTSKKTAFIINGTSDWVYEEEFGLRDGFRWSPDGTKIAYWQFDSEGVQIFNLINNVDSLYPKVIPIPYPKVGTSNSACRVGVISVQGGPTTWFEVPGDPRNNYIPKMDWADNSTEIVIQQVNRLQNTNIVMLGDSRDGSVRAILTERDDAWLDVHNNLKWLEKGRFFTWVSERTGWRHAYLISRSGNQIQPITSGDFDVIRIEEIEKESGWLYYIASPQNPTQRYLFRTKLDGSGTPERLSPANQSGTHSYDISPDGKWAFHSYSVFDQPPIVSLVQLPEHQIQRVLVANERLRTKVNSLSRKPVDFFRIPIENGLELDGWCIKPYNFDPSKKYPLFIYVYGEPAGQTVLDRWSGLRYLWHRLLAQRGYVVISIDNRGTPAPRGRDWRKCVYRQIGILASADQAAAVNYIKQNWSFIDSSRIGIWGWSGGGQMTLNALFRYPELYHTGIAVAFVSDQRLYDTIYQERYMGLPDDNLEGYVKGSPLTFADQLQGNLLIIHGTVDDNVHYQSFEMLVNKLIAEDKQFSMMSYPNRAHSMKEGKNTKRHLYKLMQRFLEEHLPPGAK